MTTVTCDHCGRKEAAVGKNNLSTRVVIRPGQDDKAPNARQWVNDLCYGCRAKLVDYVTNFVQGATP